MMKTRSLILLILPLLCSFVSVARLLWSSTMSEGPLTVRYASSHSTPGEGHLRQDGYLDRTTSKYSSVEAIPRFDLQLTSEQVTNGVLELKLNQALKLIGDLAEAILGEIQRDGDFDTERNNNLDTEQKAGKDETNGEEEEIGTVSQESTSDRASKKQSHSKSIYQEYVIPPKVRSFHDNAVREYIVPNKKDAINDFAHAFYEAQIYIKEEHHPEHMGFRLFNANTREILTERKSFESREKVYVIPIPMGNYTIEMTNLDGDVISAEEGAFEVYINHIKVADAAELWSGDDAVSNANPMKEFSVIPNGLSNGQVSPR